MELRDIGEVGWTPVSGAPESRDPPTSVAAQAVQVEAAKKLGEFFPNREGINIDLAEEPEPEVPEEDVRRRAASASPSPSRRRARRRSGSTGSTGRVWPRDGRRAGDPRRKSAFLPS